MRRDARSRKQNCTPQLPIQRIPQRGESRGVIGVVVHRRYHGGEPRVTQKPRTVFAASPNLDRQRVRRLVSTRRCGYAEAFLTGLFSSIRQGVLVV